MTSTYSLSHKPDYHLTLLVLTLPLLFHSQPSRLSPSRWRHRTTLQIFSNYLQHFLSFSHSEDLSYAINSPFSRTFNISFFHSPTSSTINSFLDEFNLFIPTINSNTIILGDFNIPNTPMIYGSIASMDPYDPLQSLNKLLTSFNLIQHVTSPTHVHGNALYLIISPKTNKIVTDHSIGPLFSDYFLIFHTLSHPNPPDPSLPESHANSTASTFLILFPIFLPFQPQRLMNSVHLSPPPSINMPPCSLKPPSHTLIHHGILYSY